MMNDDRNKRVPDLRHETPTTPAGHRALFWLWIVGMVLFSLAIWGVAKMATYLQPPTRGNALTSGQ